MKKVIIILLTIASFSGFSQNESCAFSDNNYHYNVLLIIDNIPPIDFDKTDLIEYLEINSNISNTEVIFLNENIIEAFKALPSSQSEPFNKMIYIIASDDSLDSYLNSFTESIDLASIYCDCELSDSYFHNYVRLIIDEIPADDFNKMDFINHLETISNISSSDSEFLNNSIIDVTPAFPASQTESLQKTLFVISEYDLMIPFLYEFTESINLVELICEEAELTVDGFNLKSIIRIIPNPVTQNTYIHIDNIANFESLMIIDITGKLIYSKKIKNLSLIEFGQFNLENGVYFAKFIQNNLSITKKIIVN
ncbi:T9SS type A sorting domain-containing protein [Psychroserpens mesophilus]|uniref:T9SS type A sorting domain-containing protein n=1 Tax=Psychroserpens mesophilus TaxID=325473 RepID=UPI00058AFE15|nr:T9SS type A sorting domain-containing protein [Psychroserpens mesophilus]